MDVYFPINVSPRAVCSHDRRILLTSGLLHVQMLRIYTATTPSSEFLTGCSCPDKCSREGFSSCIVQIFTSFHVGSALLNARNESNKILYILQLAQGWVQTRVDSGYVQSQPGHESSRGEGVDHRSAASSF